ncbi:MAG: peptidoglycan DD-metalloendopeptidase family protein [Deltaproteobacteria bacterium]|nr:peptidoglycan DD-metalloendopeptidase family protein [Deltaproteobacteria bacterium]
MIRRVLFPIFLAMILGLVGKAVISAQDKGEELNNLKAAEQEERQILNELDVVERQISGLEDRLAFIERESGQVRRRLSSGDTEIKETEQRVKDLKKYLIRRLRAMSRFHERDLLQVLVDAESLSEMLQRYSFLTIIMQRDEKVLSEYGRLAGELKNKQTLLKEEQSHLYHLRVDYSTQKEKLDGVRRQKTAILMRVHQRKELYQTLLTVREESRQKLIKEVIIEPRDNDSKAQTEPSTSQKDSNRKWPDFSALKGRLPRPVPGELTGRFGKTTGPFNTVITRHGWLFQAGAGTEVKAILEGEVLYIGWIRGIGNIIIVNHGRRYYTLSGGLAGIRPKVGDWVRQGQTLGVAPEGSQEEKREIYFEIRQGGQALDPAGWLGEKPVT